MAGRESYGIRNYWKFPRNKKNRRYRYTVVVDIIDRFISVLYLFKRVIKGSKYNRKMFWLDNVTIPFNKLVGCRLTKHKWYYSLDEGYPYCTKCHKRKDPISYDTWKRTLKLNQIKKRTKK